MSISGKMYIRSCLGRDRRRADAIEYGGGNPNLRLRLGPGDSRFGFGVDDLGASGKLGARFVEGFRLREQPAGSDGEVLSFRHRDSLGACLRRRKLITEVLDLTLDDDILYLAHYGIQYIILSLGDYLNYLHSCWQGTGQRRLHEPPIGSQKQRKASS